MKTKFLTKISTLSVAAGILLASCNNRVEIGGDLHPTENPIAVNAGVKDLTESKASATRTEFQNGDAIGLYVVAYPLPNIQGILLDKGNYIDNVAFNYNHSYHPNWTASSAYYPPVNVDFYAYSPYSTTFNVGEATAHQFTVGTDQTTAEKVRLNDFMTAQHINKDVNDQANAVNLEFYHRLSRIDVEFDIPTTFQDKNVTGVAGVEIINAGLTAQVDMDAEYTFGVDGTINGGNYPKPAVLASNSPKANVDTYQSAAQSGKYVYEAILAPQTFAQGVQMIKVTLNIEGGTQESFTYTVAENNGIVCKPACATLLTLSFSQDNQLQLGSVTIADWTKATHSGELEQSDVYNTFSQTLSNAPSEPITKVQAFIKQGTNPSSQLNFTTIGDASNNGTAVTFEFNEITNNAPTFYPFTITKVVYTNTAGTQLAITDNLTLEVSATGSIAIQ